MFSIPLSSCCLLFLGNTFSDEPPPLDDEEEFSPKSKDQGIFSGGDGLFDDLNDDEPFWGSGLGDKQEKG